MGYWKQIDLSLKFCRMCLIEKRYELEESGEFDEKIDEAVEKIIVKFAKEYGINCEHFKKLLKEDVEELNDDEFEERFEERFGEDFEDVVEPYMNL